MILVVVGHLTTNDLRQHRLQPKRLGVLCVKKMPVVLFELLKKPLMGHIVERADDFDIFDKPFAVAAKLLEDGVFSTVEFERVHAQLFAQLLVESRRRFQPAPVQPHFHASVKSQEISA